MTAREAISGSHHPYAVEHRSQFDALRGACEAQGLALRAVVWDDPLPAVDEFDAVVVGTTWDYAARPAEFLAALREFDARWPLSNSLSTIEWNLEKTYLRDLAQRGVPVVETLWRDRIDRETLRTAFDELSTDEVVIKPVVGASSWRQTRVRRGDPLPSAEALPESALMVQPFVPSIVSDGEYSFMFFDGVFSHAVRKQPKTGDYRTQPNHGGRTEAYVPGPADRIAAERVIDGFDPPHLLARVDLVRDELGRWMVMELELIEPYLFPEHGPAAGERFADALARRARS